MYQATSVVTAIVPTTSLAGRYPRSIRLSSPSRRALPDPWRFLSGFLRAPPESPIVFSSFSTTGAISSPPSPRFLFVDLFCSFYSDSFLSFSLTSFPLPCPRRDFARTRASTSGRKVTSRATGLSQARPVRLRYFDREYSRGCCRKVRARSGLSVRTRVRSAGAPETRATCCRRDVTADGYVYMPFASLIRRCSLCLRVTSVSAGGYVRFYRHVSHKWRIYLDLTTSEADDVRVTTRPRALSASVLRVQNSYVYLRDLRRFRNVSWIVNARMRITN